MATDLLSTWPSDLLTTTEVCAALDVSRMTVSRAVRRGALKAAARTAGDRGVYVFRLDDVRAYRDSRRSS